MKLQNHIIDEHGHIIFDGKWDMSKLETYTPEELQIIKDEALVWSILNGSMSVSQKTMMNSIYGATANEWYYFASIEAADDVTAEGRYYIKLSEEIIMNYMKNEWHLDKELHKHLKEHPELKASFKDPDWRAEVKQMDLNTDYVMYMDTDSMYVTFEELFETIGYDPQYDGSYARFIMEMNSFRLRGLFKEKIGERVAERHGENFLVFDLESISETTCFLAKKKYVMSYKMEDDKIYDDPLKHIKGKGVELVQQKLAVPIKDMIRFMVVQMFKGKITNVNYKTYMRYMYQQFSQLPFQQRCTLGSANTYDKYVLNDTTRCEFASGAGADVKGMAYYNFDVNAKGLKTKYEVLKGGKLVWYYAKPTPEHPDRFSYAFHVDEYPEELAPEMDTETQFMKLVAGPVGRIVACAGIDVGNPLASQMMMEL
ncbi:DNA polymerase family B [Chryseobacterium phage MA9V-1]|nr:DNA polymerase family B [Chryseobacterium phage MA9V-1]